jgi:hypothetical protein
MGVISESQTPWGMPGQQLRIFAGAEIDGSITEMAKRYPDVSTHDLKKASGVKNGGHPLGRGSTVKKVPSHFFLSVISQRFSRRRFKVKLIRACYFFCSIPERHLLRRSVQSPIWF